MQLSFTALLARYWSQPEIATNVIVFANLLGALLLGLLVGYERSYHGRAAGMRTYGLVCMASCALIVVVGFPDYWFGGGARVIADPARVIQGIVTGIGFLGAGVIMKEGLSISGLTTSASIWCSSAIGILVGLGFYIAAILLTLLSAGLMMWAAPLERALPSHPALALVLHFAPGQVPGEALLERMAEEWGYRLAPDSLHVVQQQGRQVWSCIAVALDATRAASPAELAGRLGQVAGVEGFEISPARN